MVLLLTTILFIRANVRETFKEYVNDEWTIIFANILTNVVLVVLTSIVLVALSNLALKKSRYRWILATILLDAFLIYTVNYYYYMQEYYHNLRGLDFSIQMITICTCITLAIMVIVYHIKNRINVIWNREDKELTLKIKNKEN